MSTIHNAGSLNIDDVYHISHIVRPGETLVTQKLVRHAGGKGLNQSIALARAGAAVQHWGYIGKDGIFLRDILQNAGVDISGVSISDLPTGRAIIQVTESGENAIFLFGGANLIWKKEDINQLINHTSKGDVLLIQNEINGVQELMEAASSAGMRIAMNPAPMTPNVKDCPMYKLKWLIINELESRELAGLSTEIDEKNESEAEQADRAVLDTLQDLYPETIITITLGKRGAIRTEAGKITRVRFPDVGSVVDTTGAGDTFTGYWLTAELTGLSPMDGLIRACAAASIAITRHGAARAIPVSEEVNIILQKFNPLS